jgi:FtsH-binding integral membrane protein
LFASVALVGGGVSAVAVLPDKDGKPMDLVILVLVVALIGFLVFVITTKIPMPPGWAMAIQVGALVVIILYLLTRFVNLPNVLPR